MSTTCKVRILCVKTLRFGGWSDWVWYPNLRACLGKNSKQARQGISTNRSKVLFLIGLIGLIGLSDFRIGSDSDLKSSLRIRIVSDSQLCLSDRIGFGFCLKLSDRIKCSNPIRCTALIRIHLIPRKRYLIHVWSLSYITCWPFNA